MAGVVTLPEKVLKKIQSSILPQWKVCFFAAILAGLLAHLYKITGWIPNWDSLVFRYDPQNMVALGRWFLPVVCSFSSFYDLPFLNGIIAIFFHALGAVCICRILKVQTRATALMIGAMIATFPTVTSVMMYNYVADGYSIAFFLSTLAVYFMVKDQPRYILSAILIALSTGIYQAYITVTIMLILMKMIDDMVYQNVSLPTLFKKAGFMLLTGIGGMALYFGVMKLSLHFCSAQLLEYQGLNQIGSNLDLLGSLYTIKETFMNCFFDFSAGINLYVILNILVAVFTAAHFIKYVVKNKLYKRKIRR